MERVCGDCDKFHPRDFWGVGTDEAEQVQTQTEGYLLCSAGERSPVMWAYTKCLSPDEFQPCSAHRQPTIKIIS